LGRGQTIFWVRSQGRVGSVKTKKAKGFDSGKGARKSRNRGNHEGKKRLKTLAELSGGGGGGPGSMRRSCFPTRSWEGVIRKRSQSFDPCFMDKDSLGEGKVPGLALPLNKQKKEGGQRKLPGKKSLLQLKQISQKKKGVV